MPWYEIFLVGGGLSGGCFVPGIYKKLKAKLVDWANG
jgi:hypothetical protein